ncbi:glycerate kinase [Limnobacter sp.]|uniref:glycerate kinase type-2 family protein n=1 Tax=Limnobacter sp. TaxID=2003368 RepID=UPI0025831C0C|nr:glycerate kinase [Limnobacter sp.]
MNGNPEFFERLLTEAFEVGVNAAKPLMGVQQCWQGEIRQWLDTVAPERKAVWVYGAGKAAASMASALEFACSDAEQLKGFVVTRRGHEVPTRCIEVVQAAHPVPDEEGQRAALRLIRELSAVPQGDAVIALVSGGGSSLLSVPVPSIPFSDLQQLNRVLLASGAPIQEMNVVRKHVTRSLGGQLAAGCSVPVFQLLISDVPGDAPEFIASGPFVADDSTFRDAMDVLDRWEISAPQSVISHLEAGIRGDVPETPGRDSAVFKQVSTRLLASNALTLDAVALYLQNAGYAVLSLGDSIEGESRDVAGVTAAMVAQIAQGKSNWPKLPVALISGGECTVTLTEKDLESAKGGRNSEFLLALFHALGSMEIPCSVSALAADTDGIDGVGGHAGALLLPGDLDRAATLGLSTKRHLDQHNSYDFFDAMGRLLMTGPTTTNVNDLRIVLIGQPAEAV